MFEPAGYSLNCLSGASYLSLHVTPEEPGSYTSFETNLDFRDDPTKTVKQVVDLFEPESFDVVCFVPDDTPLAVTVPGYDLRRAIHERLAGYHVTFQHFFRPQPAPRSSVSASPRRRLRDRVVNRTAPKTGFVELGRHFVCVETLGISVDVGGMNLTDEVVNDYRDRFPEALREMRALEAGERVNETEQRAVGHYWLRSKELAPSEEVSKELTATQQGGLTLGRQLQPRAVLWVGVGGSALGPQLLHAALCHHRFHVEFIDNTDPDGMRRALEALPLAETLVVVVSKSGTTTETMNALDYCARAFREAGLVLADQAVAVTAAESPLAALARRERWRGLLPVPMWVGGRTSLFSAVGLFFAALVGIDADALLRGAAKMDLVTRTVPFDHNPAALLATVWHHARATGAHAMVLMPYKDALALFPRYAQQLVMESLGKRLTRDGREIESGLAVYGNKGSTDQHALVQQLREGPNDFFAAFVEVLEQQAPPLTLPDGFTPGQHLLGALLGTRMALGQAGRRSLTITLPRIDAEAVGALVALFERTVGFYASLVNINAYDQPGVEAGKLASSQVLAFQKKLRGVLSAVGQTAQVLATEAGSPTQGGVAFYLLRRLAVEDEAVEMVGSHPLEAEFRLGGLGRSPKASVSAQGFPHHG